MVIAGASHSGPLVEAAAHSLLVRTGVPAPLIAKYKEESKFKLVRFILDELDLQGEKGIEIQHKRVRDLARMQVTDPSVSQKDAEEAVATLRAMAQEEGILEDPVVKAAQEPPKRRSAVPRRTRVSALSATIAVSWTSYAANGAISLPPTVNHSSAATTLRSCSATS